MTWLSTTDTHEVDIGRPIDLANHEAASGSGATAMGRIVEEVDGELHEKCDTKMG